MCPELKWEEKRLLTAESSTHFGPRLKSHCVWGNAQVAAANNCKGSSALHIWLLVLHMPALQQVPTCSDKADFVRCVVALCMFYGIEQWQPAKHGAITNMSTVLTRVAKLASGIHAGTSQTASECQ